MGKIVNDINYFVASPVRFKVILLGTIHNDDFERNAALQCDIVSNGYNVILTFQRCVALKIVVANRLV